VPFTRQQNELLKSTICKGATDDELALFAHVCSKLGLDPFSKQIYAVKRWDKNLKREVMSFQVGIDGFRSIAERTGQLDGHKGPFWCGPDGVWKDVWLDDKPPVACRIEIYRKGCAQPFIGIARYEAYVQRDKEGNPTKFWKAMGDNQLAKCAEALGLRKAFPADLSGLYATEEMEQADSDVQPKADPAKGAKAMLKDVTLARVEDISNGLWVAVDEGGDKFIVSLPESAAVSRDAISKKSRVDIGYHLNTKGSRVMDWIEPSKEKS
jgi:phage recombination protein Bet